MTAATDRLLQGVLVLTLIVCGAGAVLGLYFIGRWPVAAGVTGVLLEAPFGISYRPFLEFLAVPLLLVAVALTTRPTPR